MLPTYRTNAHNCFANHCRHETYKTISLSGVGIIFLPSLIVHYYFSNYRYSIIKLSDNQLSDI